MKSVVEAFRLCQNCQKSATVRILTDQMIFTRTDQHGSCLIRKAHHGYYFCAKCAEELWPGEPLVSSSVEQ